MTVLKIEAGKSEESEDNDPQQVATELSGDLSTACGSCGKHAPTVLPYAVCFSCRHFATLSEKSAKTSC